MCHYLMALGLLIISNLNGALTCRTGTLEQCHTLPFVPGYERAGEGYDVVKLERKGAYVLDVYNYLSPTNSCRICANPLMGGQLQKLPYYMADWRSQNQCTRVIQSSAFSSVSSVVESASSVIRNDWGIGLGLGDKVGVQLAGSKSEVHSFSSSSFQSDKSSINVNQFSCTHYRFRVSNRYPLSGEFQRDIQSLPLEYTANTTVPYRRFIDTYGTHYIRLVDLGGRMNKVTTIRTCLATLNTVTAGQVERCMSTGIKVGLGFADLALDMTSEACKKVANNRDTVTNYDKGFLNHMTEVVGGNGWSGAFNLTTEDSDGFTKWKNSLKRLPDILSFTMSPLHELVSDAKIMSNLQTAISVYVIENGIERNYTQEICTPKPNLSPDCCPLLAGRGHLTVLVERGYSIHGDWWFEPEIYVKVIHGGQRYQTHMISSHDPVWNINYNFGNVNTHITLHLEVWEQDPNSEEKYGDCYVDIQAGGGRHHCGLSSGSISFSYQLTCDSQLIGNKCNGYMPAPQQTAPYKVQMMKEREGGEQ